MDISTCKRRTPTAPPLLFCFLTADSLQVLVHAAHAVACFLVPIKPQRPSACRHVHRPVRTHTLHDETNKSKPTFPLTVEVILSDWNHRMVHVQRQARSHKKTDTSQGKQASVETNEQTNREVCVLRTAISCSIPCCAVSSAIETSDAFVISTRPSSPDDGLCVLQQTKPARVVLKQNGFR